MEMKKEMVIHDTGFNIGEYCTSLPNTLTNEAVIHEINTMFKHIESAICRTIGPYGTDVLIQSFYNNDVPLFQTRDGFTVIKNMSFTQAIPNAYYKLIRDISEYMEYKVGDSTSSGIPIASALYKSLIDLYTDNENKEDGWKFSPVGINNILSIIIDIVKEGITNNPKYQLTLSNLKTDDEKIEVLTKLGTISANNDRTIGKEVAELFRDKLDGKGTVKVLPSTEEYTEIKTDDAFEISRGMVDSDAMANDSTKKMCVMENPKIAMFDNPLMDSDIPATIKMIKHICFDQNQPLVITAPSYDSSYIEFIIKTIKGNYFNTNYEIYDDGNVDPLAKPYKPSICLLIVSPRAMYDMNDFDDLSMMIDAHPFYINHGFRFATNKSDADIYAEIDTHLGTCGKMTAGYTDAFFYSCRPNEEARSKRIEDLEDEIRILTRNKFHKNELKISNIKNRLTRIIGKTTTISIGASSEKTKYAKELIYNDVVAAIKTAINDDGVSIGGNISVAHYCYHNRNEIIKKVMEFIADNKINITAGTTDVEEVRTCVKNILSVLQTSFGNAYRYALFNMYQNTDKSYKTWESLITNVNPTIYNIMTGKDEKFLPFNVNGDLQLDNQNEFTDIIVPRNTDVHLMNIIFETISLLIKITKMVTVVHPDMDINKIRINQMSQGGGDLRSGIPMN